MSEIAIINKTNVDETICSKIHKIIKKEHKHIFFKTRLYAKNMYIEQKLITFDNKLTSKLFSWVNFFIPFEHYDAGEIKVKNQVATIKVKGRKHLDNFTNLAHSIKKQIEDVININVELETEDVIYTDYGP